MSPVNDGTPPVGSSTDPTGTPPVEPGENAGTPPGEQEPETFSREYVEQLRSEAADYRVKAKRAETAETFLQELAIRQGTDDILVDSDDLPWSDEFNDDNGYPSFEKIRTAAEALIIKKPHLGRPRGDVGQGRQSDSASQVSLSEILRAGA